MPSRPPSRCTSCGTRRDARGNCPNCRPASQRKAAHTRADWRWVYDDKRWPPLRDQVLSEEALCRAGCGRPPGVVDHIRPHRGDEQLAFDRANLQAMCKPCHDSKTAVETGFAGGGPKRLAPAKVTLVCGPPCSGKTTYVRDRAQPGDLVVDWDALAQALGSPHPWDHPAPLTPFIAEARDAVTARLGRSHAVENAWLIATAPRDADRQRLAPAGATVVVLATDEDECVRRARQDSRPAGTIEAIESWWRTHRADQH
ncbi:AAA family ATPase [Streptomyces sp. NBC_00385]|uniref:AAA family ATPase n=1 Tax=Streptomyces sp. NBC_00385 TaxID=2975733 RepID=UPI002DD7A286|nr:AAA family ATPase [Streptomyces sp. NBC_00385]WRZ05074.1 HNH endonuclease [Streptomyces sp. NBC_00385]